MDRQTLKFAVLSQLVLFIAAITCVILTSYPVKKGWPYSSYGTFLHTIVPFALGLGLSSLFLMLCRQKISTSQSKYRLLRNLLLIIALLQLGVIITPYTWGIGFAIGHVVASIGMFAAQLVFTLTIGRKILDGPIAFTIVGVQTLAALIALLSSYTFKIFPLLLPAQALASVAFACIFIWTIKRLPVSDNL